MSKKTDYRSVTELPGFGVTKEQLSMAVTRYNLAADLANGKRILELGCGAGIGLGLMKEKALSVTGGDVDPSQVELGIKHYQGRIDLVELSAESLPFPDDSFDVVVILEAIYYIENIDVFMKEVKRVLSPNGVFMVSYPNKEWPNFNPSPFTHKYFTIQETESLIKKYGFTTPKSFVAYPHDLSTFKSQIINVVRKAAVKLRLIPKSFALKNIFKRVFLGKLKSLPSELKLGDGELEELISVSGISNNVNTFRVAYTIGTVN
jgi:ubiquinone/menaquinone biosynthesis C-methylase UbiE